MASETDINKRIAEEQAKIEVPSYQDVAWDGAWKRRSAAIWGLGAFGLMAGAGIGAAAAVSAMAAGVGLTAALLAKSVAVFSAIGISTGMAAGAVGGFSAGAAAATAKELERRMLARDIDQVIRANPEATVVLGEDVPSPQNPPQDLSGYFNVYTAVAMGMIGAAGGLVFALALASLLPAGATVATAVAAPGILSQFAMPAMGLLLGEGASVAAMTAYSVGLGASFGAFFGVNVPRISRNIISVAGDILSGKAIDAPWPKSANLPELKPILSPIVSVPQKLEPEVQMASAEGKHCAACEKDKPPMKNWENLVTQSIKEADANVAR